MQNKFIVRLEILLSVMITLSVVSCNKDNVPPVIPTVPLPEMEYFNLNNREIKHTTPGFALDVNHDGRLDLGFSTVLVGDALNHVDKLQFLITSNIEVNLPVNGSEQIPVMSKGESILLGNFDGYQWFELSSIMLVQKIISINVPPVWEGHWRNASHKYLPYQVIVKGKQYNGWVELSVDIVDEKIVLHNAAISKEPNKIIKAGE